MKIARHRVKTEIRYDVFLKTYHDRLLLENKAAYEIPFVRIHDIRDALFDDVDILCDEIHARQSLETGTNND